MRYTVGDFKKLFNWPQILNLGPTDPRWWLLLNEAVNRLMDMGTWVGTYQRYQICTNDSCLTWPRQFDTIEVVDICDSPVAIRNEWYEFLEQGPGRYNGGDCSAISYRDRGRGYVMFDDLHVNSYIRLWTQFASDAGKVVNIRGWDSNHQWVLTNNGVTAGEDITLTGTYVDSLTAWMPQVFREVIKAKTAGHVRAYSYPSDDPYRTGINPDGSPHAIDLNLVTVTPIALWEPSETIPNYRRCVIPSMDKRHGCCGSSLTNSTKKPTVTVMAKLAFIPLESDLDLLPMTNAPAVKMAMLSILRGERGDTEGSRAAMFGTFDPIRRRFIDGAVPLLEEELNTFEGAGSVVPLRLEGGVDNAGVINLI